MPRQKIAGKKGKMASKSSQQSSGGSKAKGMNKKTAPADGGVKERKKMRFRPGTVALREIKKYQRTTAMLLPRAPIQRLIRSICVGIDHELRF